MKKFSLIFVFIFVTASFAQSSPSDEAKALFEKGEYFKGINILTKAFNDPDPNLRAGALETGADFYENLVGNTNYAQSLYSQILKTELGADNPIKISAQKEFSRLESLKSKFMPQDLLLKKLAMFETTNKAEINQEIQQLISIVNERPDYYRLAEVYYYLGRKYLSTENYHKAYLSLTKSLAMKPAINFYLPVNVNIEQAYSKWLRWTINSTSLVILSILLTVTIVIFYLARPWKWVTPRNLFIILIISILWLIIFAGSYALLVGGRKISDKTMADISATAPCFVSFAPGSPNWQVLQNLFIYSIVGLAGLFLFSIGTSRLKYRWITISTNTLFAMLLFLSLITIFYLQNCDQKSVFNSGQQNGILHYIEGSNYFITFGMEPYVLTNPTAYPNLALVNVSDIHMKEWIEKYSNTANEVNKPAEQKK